MLIWERLGLFNISAGEHDITVYLQKKIPSALRMNQTSNGTQALSDSLPEPPVSQTPLGEPMDQASALLLADDPLAWNLQYWLDIGIIAIIRGEDMLLTRVRTEIERGKIPDPALRTQIDDAWGQFQKDNRENCFWKWTQMTLQSPEAKPYLRDIDRMLTDKGRKVRCYLERMEKVMLKRLGAADVDGARNFFERLGDAYQRLQQEEAADAARN